METYWALLPWLGMIRGGAGLPPGAIPRTVPFATGWSVSCSQVTVYLSPIVNTGH